MVAGVVVAVAAAAAAAAVTAAATAILQPAAVVVADLQWEHGTGIKGEGGRPPLAADFARGPSC